MNSVEARLVTLFRTVLSNALEKENIKAVFIPLSAFNSFGEETTAIPRNIVIIPKYSGMVNRSPTNNQANKGDQTILNLEIIEEIDIWVNACIFINTCTENSSVKLTKMSIKILDMLKVGFGWNKTNTKKKDDLINSNHQE